MESDLFQWAWEVQEPVLGLEQPVPAAVVVEWAEILGILVSPLVVALLLEVLDLWCPKIRKIEGKK